MNVLIVDNTSTFGGAFELALTLAYSLKDLGHANPCIVSGQPKKVLEQRIGSQIPWYHLHCRGRFDIMKVPVGLRKLSAVYNIGIRDFISGLELARIARKEKAHVIHLNNLLNDQPYGVMASKLAGIPCICCHRDYEYDSKFIRFIEKFVSQHVACSKPIESNLRAIGVPESKIAYIWDGVNLDSFAPGQRADLAKEFGIPRDRKIVSIFGRLVEWKGHEVFLHSAEKWLSQMPGSHALIVGGVSDGDPSYEGRLKKLTVDLGIESRVTFAGFRSDIADLMRASDILVHASLKPEPFGTVILEGMACGRPYVAMNEGGPNEMLEHGKSGLLVPPRDPSAMAEAICKLLSDPNYAQLMGQAARQRAIDHFSSGAFASHHLDLYRKVAR